MAGFRSLRECRAGEPDPSEVLPLSVLPYMRQPLMDWLDDVCQGRFIRVNYWTLLCQMLKIDYAGRVPHTALVGAVNEDNDLLLDLVHARLKLGNLEGHIEQLKMTLFLAGSGWRVNSSENGLEEVVNDTVREVVEAGIRQSADSPSGHLASAWEAVFGRSKNPTMAHAEMIRAVESASIPVVTPGDSKATLGKIIGQLDGQGILYVTTGASDANDGIAGIVAMMRMLWQQQTDRHGANPTIAATQERVEFLLPVAAALVHAFSTGAVRTR